LISLRPGDRRSIFIFFISAAPRNNLVDLTINIVGELIAVPSGKTISDRTIGLNNWLPA
jgi:hypothetical protein